MIYSFLGFLVEVAFARLMHNPKRDRKCRYFLPICPVYGLGAVSLLLLPEAIRHDPLLLFPCAALACTVVEYFTALVYEKVFLVPFWDYSHLPLNLHGRVCPLFSLIWGILSAAMLYYIHPWVAQFTALLPPWLFLPILLFSILDLVFTLYVLRRTRDTEALRWYLHLTRRRTA